MAEPVPAPIFFACSLEAVGLMRQSGMTDMAIATVLISTRAAAITEERLRVEWIAQNYPPHAGIRPQDILAEISGRGLPEKPSRRDDWHYDSQGYCDNPGRGY